jgi:hypothetical protein
LLGNFIERFGLRFWIDGRNCNGRHASCNEIFHQALLDGRISALGIFPLKFNVRQFLLGLGHSCFSKLPEVRCAIWHPGNDLLLGRAGAVCNQHSDG